MTKFAGLSVVTFAVLVATLTILGILIWIAISPR